MTDSVAAWVADDCGAAQYRLGEKRGFPQKILLSEVLTRRANDEFEYEHRPNSAGRNETTELCSVKSSSFLI